LFEVLKTYFSRESSLEIELVRQDGRRIELSAQNMKPEHMDSVISSLQELLEP
jgi:hypothetical protein